MLTIITGAIRAKERLVFNYYPGDRVIEPHALGRSKSGDLLLRAYQVEGASDSGKPVGWKLFRLDKSDGGRGHGTTFPCARPLYNPNDPAMTGGIIARI